jgi:hypothetical protein
MENHYVQTRARLAGPSRPYECKTVNESAAWQVILTSLDPRQRARVFGMLPSLELALLRGCALFRCLSLIIRKQGRTSASHPLRISAVVMDFDSFVDVGNATNGAAKDVDKKRICLCRRGYEQTPRCAGTPAQGIRLTACFRSSGFHLKTRPVRLAWALHERALRVEWSDGECISTGSPSL